MHVGVTRFLANPLGKLLTIEGVAFGIIGLLSVVLGFSYSAGLVVFGAVVWCMRFTGAASAPSSSKVILLPELQQQYLHDLKDAQQMKKRFNIMNDLFVIGAIPLIVGLILATLRL